MASLWRHVYFKQVLLKEIEEAFTDKETDEVLVNAHSDLLALVKRLTNEEETNRQEGKECDNFLNALDVFILILKFAQSNCNQIDNKFKLKLTDKLIDCVLKPSRNIFLAGEWIMLDQQRKEDLMNLMNDMKDQIPLKKRELLSMQGYAENPWSTPAVKNLINGKTEEEEEVLGLLSSEGVEGVVLRIEMLLESSMYREALKAVSTVVMSLISEDMILQSYVSTSAPSIVDRLIDIFIILSVKLNKTLRLLKVLKQIGFEDINKIYIRRITAYITGQLPSIPKPEPKPKPPPAPSTSDANKAAEKEEKKKKLPTGDDDEESDNDDDIEMLDTTPVVDDDNDNEPSEDRFKLLDKGRCEKLLTEENCQKALEVMLQWSLASVAVQDSEIHTQELLINGWMDSCMHNKEKFNDDMEVLLECTTHSTFLYTLAHAWHKRLKDEVEVRCLQIFVKALTRDINEYEAVKRVKSSKSAMEAKLARAFWLLSDMVYDRTSLSRECVLTGFSIKPDQRSLDRIIELARISGVDQTEADSDEEVEKENEVEKLEANKSGLHCRVTIGEEGEKKKRFLKSYHQARKLKDNTEPLDNILQSFSKVQQGDNNDGLQKLPFQDLEKELETKSFTVTATKLRTNKPREKRQRNLEGLIAIRGELVTEAANYNPLDKPCKSLDAETLNLPSALTDDLLIVISAPRWHMLTWVMAWPDLLKACKKLLSNPKLREPVEDLKYLNIDYTQFNGWSSDEEVTIYTGIEKGYEEWVLEGPDNGDDKVSESEASTDDEVDHKIHWEDYDDVDKYVVPEDYNPEHKNDQSTKDEENIKSRTDKEDSSKDNKDDKVPKDESKIGMEESSGRKRKHEDSISEKVKDEFCKESSTEAKS